MAKNKEKLIEFLKRRAWNPVLRAKPDMYSDADRRRLERVQGKTKTQVERYEAYETAGQVRQEFQDDLSSQAARPVNADLKKLGLPRQADVADEFFDLADQMHVEPERPLRAKHKPHPPHPWHKKDPAAADRAERELIRMARQGDEEAKRTLRSAPGKWRRDI